LCGQGPDWAKGGYCFVPYDYMTNPKYCDDVWTIRKGDLDFKDGIKTGAHSFDDD
jgi:hypothetical protein